MRIRNRFLLFLKIYFFFISLVFSDEIRNVYFLYEPLSGVGIEYKTDKNRFGIGIGFATRVWFRYPYANPIILGNNSKVKQFTKNITSYAINYDVDKIRFFEPDLSLYWENYIFNSNFFVEFRIERYASVVWKIRERPIPSQTNIPNSFNFTILFPDLDAIYKEFNYDLYFPAYYRTGIAIGYNFSFWEKYFIKLSLGLSFLESSRKSNRVIFFPNPIEYNYFNEFYNYQVIDFLWNQRLIKQDYKRAKIPYIGKLVIGYQVF